jgi:hypothetical protein
LGGGFDLLIADTPANTDVHKGFSVNFERGFYKKLLQIIFIMPQGERKDNFFCSQFVIGAKAGQDRRLLLLTRPPCMVLKIVDFACYSKGRDG